jgi:hypothetical protein
MSREFEGKALTAPCAEILREAAHTHEERYSVYGDNFLHFGKTMKGYFPEGITLNTEDDFVRFNLFIQIAGKLSRYAQNFSKGGHFDSVHDAIVYSAMLTLVTKK